MLSVPLLGGDARDRLLHLGGKATPGRIRAVGLGALRRRQLTAKLFKGTLQFHKDVITHHRVTVIVNGQGVKHLREHRNGLWVTVVRQIDGPELR